MTDRRRLLSTALAGGLSLLAGGCATPSAAPPQTPRRVRLATGAKGGGFLLYGQAMATVLAGSSITVDVIETQGTADNIRRLDARDVDAALLVMGPAWDAWEGAAPFAGKPVRSLRALFPMYETPFHVTATAASGIGSVAQLAGRKVGVGPARGTAEGFMRGLMEALGLSITLVNGTPSEHAKQLARGEIDAFWFGAGLPVLAFVEAAREAPIRVFGLTEAERVAFLRRFPYFAPYRVPSQTYPGQAAAIESVAVWNFVAVHEGAPDDLAYWLTRLMLERRERLATAYAAAVATDAANVGANRFMPFHRGAARFLRERGVSLGALAG